VAESDGEATPDYPGPSTVIGAIIAADSHRLHDGSDVEVGGTNSREKPDPARFLRDRSVSDVIQPEVLAHASQLSLPGQSEPEELPDEAEEAMGASGEGFSRRNSLTGSALQVQMQLENGLTRRHVQENLNSRESSRRGSRDSQTSAASGSSRRFKVRRRNRSRANSQSRLSPCVAFLLWSQLFVQIKEIPSPWRQTSDLRQQIQQQSQWLAR
jgi:hypothetical protein